ncbi:MAG: rod shape-determining protein MreC [Nitrospinae bacterium]|nr:rod shape-determining protein MreC [Nitrospinota bacterium]
MAINKPHRPRVFLYLLILILLSVILITINVKGNRQPDFVENLVSALVSPLQKIISNSQNAINSFYNKYFYLVGVKEENLRLKAEMATIKSLQNELAEMKLERKRLLSLLDVKEQSSPKTMFAKIIGYDSTNWNRMVTIDKGTIHGIERKMPIVSNGGLIGKIESASRSSSKVLLITDIRNAVDAVIQESRAQGVVVGTNRELCEMKYVSLEEKVKNGGRIVSSGFGGVYPKGLLIGEVAKVERKEFGLFQEVFIKPSSDLEHLEEVMVIMGQQNE